MNFRSENFIRVRALIGFTLLIITMPISLVIEPVMEASNYFIIKYIERTRRAFRKLCIALKQSIKAFHEGKLQ